MQRKVCVKLKVAAIDIGTNSTRLLIVDASGDERHDLFRSAVVTRLGEGTNATKALKPEAIDRTISALLEFAEEMRAEEVEKIRATATSAARDASNASDFTAAFREALGFDVEILSGHEEAELTFRGALSDESLADPNSETLVIDVGGGSTEFIWGRGRAIEGCESIDIGSVRLTEMCVRSDPPTDEDLERVREAINRAASNVLDRLRERSISRAIAVAGTATSLSAIHHELTVYDPQIIHGSILGAETLSAIIERLRAVNAAERSRIPGLQRGREDVIISGALILEETLSALKVDELIVSERDILDGLIDSML